MRIAGQAGPEPLDSDDSVEPGIEPDDPADAPPVHHGKHADVVIHDLSEANTTEPITAQTMIDVIAATIEPHPHDVSTPKA